MKDEITYIEYHNAINDCRHRVGFIFDIYQEFIAAFEKEDWQAKGPKLAIRNAEQAGIFTENQARKISEDWEQVVLSETEPSFSKSTDFGTLQGDIEKLLFNEGFNCALKSLHKLTL